MSTLLNSLWDSVRWYAAWYANWVYELWINITPVGYIILCLTVIGIGWLALKSGVKAYGG
ncbi:hypothetical protein [Alienimonas californiensis]|uniref:Uncharacterized protein n=1 Tax=Alienimonas californiensis TaxID=2527989 RepID=A0A517P9U6_9PLAN|nr:hypothetical protein [Alienimonas californiensis]QDT16151.1 hypothetical protein CA12_22490 [Alienimonas californiensis]